MDKSIIRHEILQKRSIFAGFPEYENFSKIICNNVKTLISANYRNREPVLGIYSAIKGEVDLRYLFDIYQKIAMPRLLVLEDHTEIEYAIIEDLGQLVESKLSFKEPPPQAARAEPDILLIPGVAFDMNKNRIGYGVGHFDKYISRRKKSNNNPLKIGICFNLQMVDNLPIEDHDQKMDYIITETRII